MIQGALHMPDSTFNVDSIAQLLQKAQHLVETSGRAPVSVVFHCMESARRGPRCARRLFTVLQVLPDEQVPPLKVFVLQGGFDQWVRRFWQAGEARIDGFDDDYWGFTLAAQDGEIAHTLYERPADQP